MTIATRTLSRREVFALGSSLASSAVFAQPRRALAKAPVSSGSLKAQLLVGPTTAMLRAEGAPTAVWSYNASSPGPVLRVCQAAPLHMLVKNRLSEGTTVHWHGIRLPNAMDGVPGLTQPPIAPGASFEYTFTPPDAGTFWYHSHAESAEQLGRGLAGVLIVEEPNPPEVDRELIWAIQDWRLTENEQVAPDFLKTMEEAMSGRVGNTVTINGRTPASVHVRAGERIRLRLLNAAPARIMALRFEGHRPVVVALDGQPCEPHEPARGRIILGPAMRADVIVDMQGAPGSRHNVLDDFYDKLSCTLVTLAYDAAPPVRAHPASMVRLPRNPVPRPNMISAEQHVIRLRGGMMGGASGSGAIWSMNGASMTGDGGDAMKPMFTLERGRTCVLDLCNETAWWHPMHLHGHSFQVLSRDEAAVPHEAWGDTVLVQPREKVRVAFVADNPGDWMFHCHVMGHQEAGLMTIIRIV